eukprot:14392587-Ditylum_brightwellii.AAC.2
MLAENILKLACYFIKHKIKGVSRTITQEDVTLAKVQALKNLKKWEGDDEEPKTEDYPIAKKKNLPDTFDSLDEFIHDLKGKEGLPLEYIIRTDTAAPA